MNLSKDITNKLDPNVSKVLVQLDTTAKALGISYFVVGATARDIVFSALYNVPIVRATMDVDFGIRIKSWDQFDKVMSTLIGEYHYERVPNKLQRLKNNETIIDLVPFGAIEQSHGVLSWPPDHDIVMKTIGFEEALLHAIDVKVSNDPEVNVKVSTPPALAVMKCISWKDNSDRRSKDGPDLHFILKTYSRAGNDTRIYSTDDDLLEEQLEPDEESARLLGRDAQFICTETTKASVNKILLEEISEDSALHLLSDMMGTGYRDQINAENVMKMLKQFQKGLTEQYIRKV